MPPTPEEQGEVTSPITQSNIIGSVINLTGTVVCPVVDVGVSSGGGGGKGDPVEPSE